MKIFLKGAVAALVLSLVGVSGAEAQLVATSPLCTDWDTAVPSWTNCLGAFAGNDSNQFEAVADTIIVEGWLGDGPITILGGGELEAAPTFGTIDFTTLYTNFVIALKAGNSFSLYHYEGAFSSIDYSTIGSGINCKTVEGCSEDSPINALSHWTLYGGTTTTVPEPGTLLLLGTGLLGMAMLRRREDVV